MINDKHKFIFVRVTKTASTSITDCLEKSVKLDSYKWSVVQLEIKEKWQDDENHIPMWFIEENISDKKFKSYFKFSFVRNPFDKLVSAYGYDINWHCKNKIKNDNLDTFARYIKSGFGTRLKNSSQYDFTYGCDFIGRFENLQEDINVVCDKIKIPQQQLPHKNKSKHKSYSEYYDDETKQIVAEKFAKDIEYFGYEFGE